MYSQYNFQSTLSHDKNKTKDELIESIKQFAHTRPNTNEAHSLPHSTSIGPKKVLPSPTYSAQNDKKIFTKGKSTYNTGNSSSKIFVTPKATTSAAPLTSTKQLSDRTTMLVLCESRAREVGMAAISNRTHEISITQFADNQHYSYTSELIHAFSPITIILSTTCTNTSLHKALVETFPDVPISFIGNKT